MRRLIGSYDPLHVGRDFREIAFPQSRFINFFSLLAGELVVAVDYELAYFWVDVHGVADTVKLVGDDEDSR